MIIDSLILDADISHLTGFHTAARTRYLYEIRSIEDISRLTDLRSFAYQEGLQILFVGTGANLLFAFDIFPGILITSYLTQWSYDPETRILTAGSWALISQIAESLEEQYDQPLWHRFIGLPGSIGGAVYGNAGCFGLEVEHNFIDGLIYDTISGQYETITREHMDFSYRWSRLKREKEKFLISARWDLSQLREKYHSEADVRLFRSEKQPQWYSCGSFFQNPDREHSAGCLIEQSGLKGYRVGGASISSLHANFVMSDGLDCRWQDLITLIETVQDRVEKDSGYWLVPEVQIIRPDIIL